MQRRLFCAALAAVSLSAAHLSATAAPIRCAAARDDVEQAICSHPALLAWDQAISVWLDALKQQCPAAQKLLVEGQKFWLRERWDCRNVEGAFDTPDALPSCLADRMDHRLRQLDGIGAGCDMTPLAAAYRFVDVDYLLRFSDSYLGKPVSLFGWIDLESCKAPGASPTAATVNDQTHHRFRMKFSAMPAAQREFLCAKTPASHWTGTIQHDSEGNYLFLTDVLGEKLPPP